VTSRKTDGERIAQRMAENWALAGEHVPATAKAIDRIIRKRMAEAWAAGHEYGVVWGGPRR
jgi:hypothetical protein